MGASSIKEKNKLLSAMHNAVENDDNDNLFILLPSFQDQIILEAY
jgi:hypothetical protein